MDKVLEHLGGEAAEDTHQQRQEQQEGVFADMAFAPFHEAKQPLEGAGFMYVFLSHCTIGLDTFAGDDGYGCIEKNFEVDTEGDILDVK